MTRSQLPISDLLASVFAYNRKQREFYKQREYRKFCAVADERRPSVRQQYPTASKEFIDRLIHSSVRDDLREEDSSNKDAFAHTPWEWLCDEVAKLSGISKRQLETVAGRVNLGAVDGYEGVLAELATLDREGTTIRIIEAFCHRFAEVAKVIGIDGGVRAGEVNPVSAMPVSTPQIDQTSLPRGTFAGISDIAKQFKIPNRKQQALRGRLQRFRQKHAGDACAFVEHDAPARNTPKYLYNIEMVVPLIRDLSDGGTSVR